MDHIIGAGVRSVSKSIAVVSEVVAGRKSSNARDPAITADDSDHEEDVLSREQDLDDVIDDDGEAPEYKQAEYVEGQTFQEVANGFVNRHRMLMTVPDTLTPLPNPVILPQRRPRKLSRGFIRAYAPSLGECSSIDQATFMDFLNDFDRAAKAWPIFDVINLAAFGVGLVPHEAFMIASTAMNVVAYTGEELQTRYQTNKFLDDINKALFKPRGLYALIMTYRPDMSDSALLRADITDPQSVALSKALDRDAGNSIKRVVSRFRNVSSGTTKHESLMPEPAPLIYPAIDAKYLESKPQPKQIKQGSTSITTSSPPSTTTTLLQPSTSHTSTSSISSPPTQPSNIGILQDYLDRRAQAVFLASHPTSRLASTLPPQSKKFVNRFADPDHPVNSGSLFGLVTGGNWDPIASGRIRRAERKASKRGEQPLSEKERHDAYMGREVRGRVTGTPSKKIFGLKDMFAGSVLYLVITNLPDGDGVGGVVEEEEGKKEV